VPVWAALEALGAASPLCASIHLVDTVAEAAQIVLAASAGRSAG
jgi:hypothetical protein